MNRLDLISLETRRLKSNLIKVCKLMRCIDRVESQSIFHYVGPSKTRGYRFNVRGSTFEGHLLFLSCADMWNVLPEDVVESGTITGFKRHLDQHLNRQA